MEAQPQNEVRVAPAPLTLFAKELFVRMGFAPEDAETEAEVLVWANLRGVDSHGVLRLPLYAGWVDAGIMNPRPEIRVERETPATLLIDADQALGPVVTTMAMRRVIDKAKTVGLGWGLIRNTTHQGAMGYYSLMAAEQGLAGIALVCGGPNMAPPGARAAGVANAPIAIAVPGKRHRPLVLDMATSIVARGKIDLAVDRGTPIPIGWALDSDGNPTTDPNAATITLPSGGPKGSGLALMFECLSSLMVGNPMLEPVVSGRREVRRGVQNSLVAAVDIATFTDVDGYKKDVDDLIDALKALPKADGADEILVPGEPEWRTHDDRVRNGVPLPDGTVRNLRDIAARFDIALPEGL